MKPEDHLNALTADLASISEVGAETAADTSVPGCPPWTIEDLLVHLSQIWTFVARSTQADAPIDRASVTRPDGSAVDWHRASAAELIDVLSARNPADKTWAFDLPDADVAFWLRRMCHEASIHRYDIQVAAGNPQPVAHAVAIDGINEIFDYLIPRRKPADFAGSGETLHLHVTDEGDGATGGGGQATGGDQATGGGEWFITRTSDGIEVEAKHAKGDVAARGTASDLLLMLWGRIKPDQLDVIGDAAQLDQWQQKINM